MKESVDLLLHHFLVDNRQMSEGNSHELNCGPLSDRAVSGIPSLAKMDLQCSVTATDIVCFRCTVSVQRE